DKVPHHQSGLGLPEPGQLPAQGVPVQGQKPGPPVPPPVVIVVFPFHGCLLISILPPVPADLTPRHGSRYNDKIRSIGGIFMSDIIAAVSTGRVVSAIGIVRLSGPGCIPLAFSVFTAQGSVTAETAEDRKLYLGSLYDARGR